MDNKTKNLLVGAIEECGKITQSCSKAIKFGLFSQHPCKKDRTNGEQIVNRYYRLQAIIEKLQNEHVLPRFTQSYIESIKRESINNTKPPKKSNKK